MSASFYCHVFQLIYLASQWLNPVRNQGINLEILALDSRQPC